MTHLPWRLKMIPMICVMGTIFALSHQPADDLINFDFPLADKAAHFLIYGVLAWTVIFAFVGGRRTTNSLPVLCGIVMFCIVYGISDEYHQSFIVGREPSAADLLADALGAVAVCVLCWRHRILQN